MYAACNDMTPQQRAEWLVNRYGAPVAARVAYVQARFYRYHSAWGPEWLSTLADRSRAATAGA